MTAAGRRDRKTEILDAAERVFAAHGFAGASLRAIVAAAGVNLPTVYYYYGSKQGLMRAVLERRFAPLHREQLALLARYTRGARGRPLPVERILQALVRPPLRLGADAAARRAGVLRLVGRVLSETDAETRSVARRLHADVRAAFVGALRLSLPRVPLAELQWRIDVIVGALAYVLCTPQGTASGSTRQVQRTVRFLARGLGAPSAPSGRQNLTEIP
jgi:AcrR family transcriptional regulator